MYGGRDRSRSLVCRGWTDGGVMRMLCPPVTTHGAVQEVEVSMRGATNTSARTSKTVLASKPSRPTPGSTTSRPGVAIGASSRNVPSGWMANVPDWRARSARHRRGSPEAPRASCPSRCGAGHAFVPNPPALADVADRVSPRTRRAWTACRASCSASTTVPATLVRA